MKIMNVRPGININISYDSIGRTQLTATWTDTPGNCGVLPLIVNIEKEYVVDVIKREIARCEAITEHQPTQLIGKLKELLDWTDSYQFRDIK